MTSADAAALEGVTVTIEARRAGETSPPVRKIAEIRKTAADRRWLAAADAFNASLRPGTWIISAIVRRNEDVVGQVSRTIVVDAPREDPR